ncbi:hypothetical protein PLANPX_3044 [Lacipirellula parvula]|uniref:Uncharacterized protein n=1 Tax=Lacipirellula parvula TaxID=2650471 RepID=A0A5K7XBV5_9BACT|nr:hypothetical protein PLANPX_3044 [Lacipirellula parvula]
MSFGPRPMYSNSNRETPSQIPASISPIDFMVQTLSDRHLSVFEHDLLTEGTSLGALTETPNYEEVKQIGSIYYQGASLQFIC